MNIQDAAIKAVREKNHYIAGAISDRLRAAGLNYDETYEVVRIWTDVSKSAWEALMYEADCDYVEREYGHDIRKK